MSGEKIFKATAQLRLPPGLTVAELQSELEQLGHDLMVDIRLHP
jgi:glycine cleavage system regulatory protein